MSALLSGAALRARCAPHRHFVAFRITPSSSANQPPSESGRCWRFQRGLVTGTVLVDEAAVVAVRSKRSMKLATRNTLGYEAPRDARAVDPSAVPAGFRTLSERQQ